MNKIDQLIMSKKLLSQTAGHIVSDMNGEKVMLSISNGKYYNLGETGGEIWELLHTPITIHSLVHRLMEKFEVEQAECEKHVTDFLDLLLKEGLIKVED